ncbi:hypothetical protein ACX80W_14750 [Arthrobacter sp. TMN-37]
MNVRRSKTAASALLAGGILLTGCTSNIAAADTGDLPSFASVEEARTAVDEVLDCEDNLTADPVQNRIVDSTVESVLCTEHVQLELYANDEDRKTTVEAFSHSGSNGYERMPIIMVDGSNWAVYDFSEARGLPSRVKDMERLAQELNAGFTRVEGVKAQ